MTDSEKKDLGIAVVRRAVARHGENNGLGAAVAHMDWIMTRMWSLMDEPARRQLMHSEEVQDLLAAWASDEEIQELIEQYGELELGKDLQEIAQRLEAMGDGGALDALLYEAYAGEASRINNEGLKSQLDALQALGHEGGHGDLDEVVHDAYAGLASDVNNEGTLGQLRALQKLGYTARDIETHLDEEGFGPTR